MGFSLLFTIQKIGDFPCMEPPIDSQPQALGPPPGLEEVLGSAHLQQHLATAQAPRCGGREDHLPCKMGI